MNTRRVNMGTVSVDLLSGDQALQQVLQYARQSRSGYACFVNVHMLMESHDHAGLRESLGKANWCFADGMPIAWLASRLSNTRQERIAGMDFVPRILREADRESLSVFCFGSTPEVLEATRRKVIHEYPNIRWAGCISPPFRALTHDEMSVYVSDIENSGAQLVLVALGCPKQEQWMRDWSSSIPAVCLGIGGALPVFAGLHTRAPRWMQQSGLEWLYRWMQEPARLFRRYAVTNSRFLVMATRMYVTKMLGRPV